MGCGCRKKIGGSNHILFPEADSANGDPSNWGPALWAMLHCIAERIGLSASASIDIDQARAMETVITLLPTILPCPECQAHCRLYIQTHTPNWIPLRGETLRTTVRQWLLDFHNSVRARKEQPITVNTLDDLSREYAGCNIQSCQTTLLAANVAFMIRLSVVKMEAWKRWNVHFNRIRVLVGL